MSDDLRRYINMIAEKTINYQLSSTRCWCILAVAVAVDVECQPQRKNGSSSCNGFTGQLGIGL